MFPIMFKNKNKNYYKKKKTKTHTPITTLKGRRSKVDKRDPDFKGLWKSPGDCSRYYSLYSLYILSTHLNISFIVFTVIKQSLCK